MLKMEVMLEMLLVLIMQSIRGGRKKHLLELLHPSPVVDGVGTGHAFHDPRCRHVTETNTKYNIT